MSANPSTTLFLPAWNEAENLTGVVTTAVDHFESKGITYKVIIVDDGSTDGTHLVARQLEETFPDRVQHVRHDTNRGYGAALCTGFRASLLTGHEWIAFCDADGQFSPPDVGILLDEALRSQADIAIGYRIARADNLKRRLMGRGWHWLSSVVLGYKAKDVDCGFKIFRRDALDKLVPHLDGDHATISPQLLTLAHRARHRIVEVGVQHYPRQYGEQSGASLRVVVASLVGLFRIRQHIRHKEIA